MANTYDLTQTGSEVQAILNDANNIKGAGAQTTLTTDYILLKDTNGQYHKILKDSFTEACRNVLAGLLVNNDKGTTISQIAAIASGDFGSVTPANLASVLGAGTDGLLGSAYKSGSNTDMNNFPATSVGGVTYWSCPSSTTNKPIDGNGGCVNIQRYDGSATGWSTQSVMQVYYSNATTSNIYIRTGYYDKTGTNTSWKPWINLTNYT